MIYCSPNTLFFQLGRSYVRVKSFFFFKGTILVSWCAATKNTTFLVFKKIY